MAAAPTTQKECCDRAAELRRSERFAGRSFRGAVGRRPSGLWQGLGKQQRRARQCTATGQTQSRNSIALLLC